MSDVARRTVWWQVKGRPERTKATLDSIRFEVFSVGPPEP